MEGGTTATERVIPVVTNPDELLAVILKVVAEREVVGVPEICPEEELIVSPEGKLGETEKERGREPSTEGVMVDIGKSLDKM